MLSHLLIFSASGRQKTRKNRRRTLNFAPLEERRLLTSVMDLTTAATVSTITNGVAVVQPMKADYATRAQSVQVNFSTSDPDDPGVTPTTHFKIKDVATGDVLVSDGTGTSLTLSNEGLYQVQYWSTDADDSEAVAAHSIVIAIDRTAPTITIDSVTPNVLWPPNGKLVAVTVTGIASDSLSGVNASSLGFHVVDEYGKVEPSGSITNITRLNPTSFGGSAQVDFTFQVMLQVRRFGFDRDGRQYTIDVTASDMAGNTGVGSAVVIVPHDMGRNHGFHGAGHQGSQGDNGGGKAHGKGSHGSGGQGDGAGSLGGRTGSGEDHGRGNGHGAGHRNDQGNGNGSGNGDGTGDGNGNGHGHGKGNG
jgi:hypothetical protein